MYLLDTNILSELIKKRPNLYFMARLKSEPAERLFTSCVCVMELRFGSALRNDPKEFWLKIVDEILKRIQILPWGYPEALMAGDILATLKKKGQITGVEDIQIASTAIRHGMVVVTANTRHFEKIDGLVIENWLI